MKKTNRTFHPLLLIAKEAQSNRIKRLKCDDCDRPPLRSGHTVLVVLPFVTSQKNPMAISSVGRASHRVFGWMDEKRGHEREQEIVEQDCQSHNDKYNGK